MFFAFDGRSGRRPDALFVGESLSNVAPTAGVLDGVRMEGGTVG